MTTTNNRRKDIPVKIRNKVMDEFNWRCAFCGHHNPHIHHINENHDDNREDNLLPLCPNCHLTDQHNPTRTIEHGRLVLFRKHKDPFILTHQFQPIYERMEFLYSLEPFEVTKIDYCTAEECIETRQKAKELVSFVECFVMGSFYSVKIQDLLVDNDFRICSEGDWNASDRAHVERYVKALKYDVVNFQKALLKNSEQAEKLIVQMLRYQDWRLPNRSTESHLR